MAFQSKLHWADPVS
ncbi:Protein of unknown function [Propionibacterium freudenreichii]|nr:Protein of unknown function [Propionibacterium freudenreichii]